MFRMTRNVLRNLVAPKATRGYPFVTREAFQNYRGHLAVDIDNCIFCGLCARKCPSQCIVVDVKEGKWDCDAFACIYCGICADHCPTDALEFGGAHRTPVTERFTINLSGETPKQKKARLAAKAANGNGNGN